MDTIISIRPNLADKDLLNFFEWWKWIDNPGERGPVVLDFTNVSFVAHGP